MTPNRFGFGLPFYCAVVFFAFAFTTAIVAQDLANKETRLRCNLNTHKLHKTPGFVFDQIFCLRKT